jgi:hypothetical protein
MALPAIVPLSLNPLALARGAPCTRCRYTEVKSKWSGSFPQRTW